MCFKDSCEKVKNNADFIINSTSLKDELRYIKKLYHARDIDKKISKINSEK